MMKEKLVIKNFGPIKSVELDLNRFNVLIGENATGKSTVAKVLAMCRYFSYIIKNDLSEQPFDAGLISRGLDEFVQNNTYIYYDCKHYSLTVQRILEKVREGDQQDGSYFEYDFPIFSSELQPKSDEFKNLLLELEAIKPKDFSSMTNINWSIPTSFFLNDVARVMDNPFYLPTERGLQSIFSLGKNSIQNISDSLFNQFAELDQIARSFKKDTLIEPLDITYKNVDGKGYIRKKNEEQFYSLYNGASGYKSAIPIVLVVKYYNEEKKKKKTFLIEEPELNLFPRVQQELVNYLAANTVNMGGTVLLTTHSPYILTSLNNLMYAYQVGQNFELEASKIIDKKYWINPSDVSAYILNSNGEIENILNEKESLIDAEKIDGISSKLNKEFNELIDIEIANTSEIN